MDEHLKHTKRQKLNTEEKLRHMNYKVHFFNFDFDLFCKYYRNDAVKYLRKMQNRGTDSLMSACISGSPRAGKLFMNTLE